MWGRYIARLTKHYHDRVSVIQSAEQTFCAKAHHLRDRNRVSEQLQVRFRTFQNPVGAIQKLSRHVSPGAMVCSSL